MAVPTGYRPRLVRLSDNRLRQTPWGRGLHLVVAAAVWLVTATVFLAGLVLIWSVFVKDAVT